MTRERMEDLISASTQNFHGRPGAVEFEFGGVSMACVSDVEHDRMRIIAPVVSEKELSARQLEILLIANFHTSLDARYSLSRGVLYSAYLHPLASLSEAQLRSALRQVASLVKTFMSTYSSGELTYGAPGGQSL